ncbi:2093_t:CDS:1, partial [Entrophospora sp. SA101]
DDGEVEKKVYQSLPKLRIVFQDLINKKEATIRASSPLTSTYKNKFIQ